MYSESLVYLRRDELIAEAHVHRLAQSVGATQPPLSARVMENISEVLTQAGEFLHQRAQDAQSEWELKHSNA
jgi:hypothetical protein